MKKRQENEVKTECASSATPDSWRTIDWASCEKKVRKLQVRIVEALKANRIGRVKALQRILINSISAKALAVRQVTSNKGGSTAGVDKETWLTDVERYNAISSLKTRGYKPKPLRRVFIPKKKRQDATAWNPNHQGQGDASPLSHGCRTRGRDTCRRQLVWFSQIPLMCGRDRPNTSMPRQ